MFAVVIVFWWIGFLVLRRLGKSSFRVAVRRVFLRVCCGLSLLFRGRRCSRKLCIPIYPFCFVPRRVTSFISCYIRCAGRKQGFIRKSREIKKRRKKKMAFLFRLMLSVFGWVLVSFRGLRWFLCGLFSSLRCICRSLIVRLCTCVWRCRFRLCFRRWCSLQLLSELR